MWMINEDGMFSAVTHKMDADLVVVRSRAEADAETLAGWASTHTGIKHDVTIWTGTDYPVRVLMTRGTWAQYCSEKAYDIEYTNFKDHVAKTQGTERAHIYGTVWSVLLRLERFNKTAPLGIYTPRPLDNDMWFSETEPIKKKKKRKKLKK